MKSSKKRSINTLKSAIAECENGDTERFNGFKRLCEAYVSTGDQKQRERAIAKIVRQEKGLQGVLKENDDIITANIEQALTELAIGCTVTEERIKIGKGGKVIQKVTKRLPPNQSAAEFLLINKCPDRYARNPEAKSENGEGRIDEILEAIKNVK